MYKQIIIVRKDLGLSTGKTSAQVAHASYESAKKAKSAIRKEWELYGQKKVILSVEDVKELKELKQKADKLGLPNSLIIDAGRTEIKQGTITCLGIGPDKEDKIDKVTGHLKLLD